MESQNIRNYLSGKYIANSPLSKCSDGKIRNLKEKELFESIKFCKQLINETSAILKDYQNSINNELKFINLSKLEDLSSSKLNNYLDFTSACSDFVANCSDTSDKSKDETFKQYYDKVERYISYIKKITNKLTSIKTEVSTILSQKREAKEKQTKQIQESIQLLEGNTTNITNTSTTPAKTNKQKVADNNLDVPLNNNKPQAPDPEFDKYVDEAISLLDPDYPSNNAEPDEPEL